MPPRDHLVSFYDHDAELVAELACYVADGLTAGDGVVVVASPVHRSLLAQALAQRGVDTAAPQAEGSYVVRDASATLSTFRSGGVLDRDRFAASIGGVLDAAGAGGRRVRVFGEMVALLWDDDDVAGALALEELWNGLATTRAFTLLCAYPTSALRDPYYLRSGNAVCVLHSDLLAPDSYLADLATLGRPDGARRRSEVFLPLPAAVQAVRRFVRCTLQVWGEPQLTPDAVLLVSELASNALQHAGTPFRVSLAQDGAALRIAVEDVEVGQPDGRAAADDDENGRGMSIVTAVATSWGTERSERGKVVWAELTTATVT